MFRLAIPRALSLLLIAAALAGCNRSGPPNVLIVTIDTLRADHVGSYGYHVAHTATLDRLAAEGVRFEDVTAAAPITMPAHSSIMTGLFPPAHGVRDNGAFVLSDDATTLAERFKAVGYDTAAFVSAIVLSRRYRLDQGFDVYDDELWSEDDPKLFMIRERPATDTVDRVLRWIDGRNAKLKAGDAVKPFFLWMHLFDPHQPYQAPRKYVAATPTAYDAEIAYADFELGRLIEQLRADGTLDDTIVVVTADHGESLGEHDEKTHAIFIYRATTRVPLIVRYPRTLPAGETFAPPVRSVDIAPTLLALAHVGAAPDSMQGVDLTRFLASPKTTPDLPRYSESLVSELGFGMAPLYGVRSRGHGYIRAPRPELYDLAKDPNETVNLEGTPGAADVAGDLDTALEQVLIDSRKRELASPQNPMSAETLENLQALGYVQGASERAAVHGMDPKDGIRIYNLLEDARHLAQQDKWPDAEARLKQILAEIPAHTSARTILALAYVREGRLDEARAEYLKLLASDPNPFRIYGMLGIIELHAGDLDKAAEYYQSALRAAPRFAEAQVQLGIIEMLRGHADQAQAWYDKALATDPTFPLIYRRMGDSLYEHGDFRAALARYEEGLAHQPDDYRALVQAGNSARKLDDPARARRFFERALEVNKHGWVAGFNLACLEATQGHADAAFAALDRALDDGMSGLELLEGDRDLATLHADPRFAARVDRLRSIVATALVRPDD